MNPVCVISRKYKYVSRFVNACSLALTATILALTPDQNIMHLCTQKNLQVLNTANICLMKTQLILHKKKLPKRDQKPKKSLKWTIFSSVTCESLVSREFSRILSTFHFSISISRHFHFTFHSRSRSQGIFISLFILEMSERKTKFTFQFSKRVKAFQISLFFSRKKE